MRDGLYTHCKNCVNQKQKQYDNKNRVKKRDYYQNNRDRIKDYYLQNRDKVKEYQLKNHNKIMARKKIYSNNKYKTDINFRLICKSRSRILQALRGKLKSTSTKEILGIDVNLYKKWMEFQFTPDMNWENIEIDHVKPICMFDVTKDIELREAFNWKNTQPLLKHNHRQKGIKFNFLDYQLQFIKVYQFLKINEEERLNENIH